MLQKYRVTFCLAGANWRNETELFYLEFVSEYDAPKKQESDAYKTIKQAYGYKSDEVEIIGILWDESKQETGYFEERQCNK